MKTNVTVIVTAITLLTTALHAQPVPVTVDNFVRAESDMYIGRSVKEAGLGKFHHRRAPASIDQQVVIRLNRDTLYSSGVFDFDAGPVTITLPNSTGRFMSMQVVNQEHYVPMVIYEPGPVTLTRENVGTRYAAVAVRTLVNPNDPTDVEAVHKLQDAIKVEQAGGPGKFEVPQWDSVSQKKVRDALLVLSETLPDLRKAGGKRGEVDPVRHLIATASGWGLNPDKDAIYLNITPKQNDGEVVYRLTVKDVPVDGFWSISVYGADGYFHKNDRDAYTLNNITAKKNDDGSVAVQFGGEPDAAPNVLPITPGWNYMVRLYRPRREIIDGTWKVPEANEVK